MTKTSKKTTFIYKKNILRQLEYIRSETENYYQAIHFIADKVQQTLTSKKHSTLKYNGETSINIKII
jgi:hypothetical protein